MCLWFCSVYVFFPPSLELLLFHSILIMCIEKTGFCFQVLLCWLAVHNLIVEKQSHFSLFYIPYIAVASIFLSFCVYEQQRKAKH